MGKEQAMTVLQILEEHGYEGYFVGGCVRDWLLGRPVHDIDICTNAQPRDIMQLFPDHIPTGLKHGTITVRQGEALFEVTTYRTESGYGDYRRPSDVQFVSELREDLARRDFTINAMAMDRRGKLQDPFNGQQDLADRRIRTVGDPYARFSEDALRLIRAARFAAQLQFTVEEQTRQAMVACRELIGKIAVERVRDELFKLVDAKHPETGAALLTQTGLLRVYPDVASLFSRSEPVVERLKGLGSLAQKWAFLCYAGNLGRDAAGSIGSLLRMSNRDQDKIGTLLAILNSISPKWDQPQLVAWNRLLLEYGWDVCVEADQLLKAVWGREGETQSTRDLIQAYQGMPITSRKELAVTGKDLVEAIGREAGPWVAQLLQFLLEQAALHGLPNTPEALLEAARKEVERHEY